jgi:uncharacterized coiled-coil protein SlyX
MESNTEKFNYIECRIADRIKPLEDQLLVQEEMIQGLKTTLNDLIQALKVDHKKLDLSKLSSKTPGEPKSERRSSQVN